jgi:hypothetical protein
MRWDQESPTVVWRLWVAVRTGVEVVWARRVGGGDRDARATRRVRGAQSEERAAEAERLAAGVFRAGRRASLVPLNLD